MMIIFNDNDKGCGEANQRAYCGWYSFRRGIPFQGALMIRNVAGHRPNFDAASALVYRSKPCRSLAATVSLALIGLILAGCAENTITDAPHTERVSRSTQSLEHTSKHASKHIFKHAF